MRYRRPLGVLRELFCEFRKMLYRVREGMKLVQDLNMQVEKGNRPSKDTESYLTTSAVCVVISSKSASRTKERAVELSSTRISII
jgi:hypothetical protein